MTTYDYIASNKRRSVMLIAVFSAIVMAIGWFLDRYYEGGGFFLFIAAAYSVVSALVGLYAGDKVALASSGARAVNGTDNPYVYRMIENMCIATGSSHQCFRDRPRSEARQRRRHDRRHQQT